MLIVGFILASLGTVIASLNLYLTFIRYPLHRLFRKDEPYKFVSVLPVFGTLFLWAAALVFWLADSTESAIIVLVISILDIGGIPLMLVFFGLHWLYELRGKNT